MPKYTKYAAVTLNNFLYGIPVGKAIELKTKKRGRGRPRKRVVAEGMTVHQEPVCSTCKLLSTCDRLSLKQRYLCYRELNPAAMISHIVQAIADENSMTYQQVYEVVDPS